MSMKPGSTNTFQAVNTVLYCQQWAASVAFYRDQLGLPILFANDWFVEFALTETARLSIADPQRSSIASVAGQGVTITLRVANVNEMRAQLLAQGIEIGRIKKRFDAHVCYFHDPEGHRLELWSPIGD